MSKKLLFSQDEACTMLWTIRINKVVESYESGIPAGDVAKRARELSLDNKDISVDIITANWVRRTYLGGEIVNDNPHLANFAPDQTTALSVAKWHNL